MSQRKLRSALLVALIVALSVLGVVAVQFLVRYRSSLPSYRAAILDELSIDYPNPTVISSLVATIKEAGFSVDLYGPSQVTVELYRSLPAKGYEFVLLRVHAAFHGGDTWLFTSEAYSKEELLNKYVVELVTDQIAPARSFAGEGRVLAVSPEFIRKTMGNWMGAVVVLAGCYGTAGDSLPKAFVDRGASAVVGWNQAVSAEHADLASLELVKRLFAEKMTVNDAVDTVMRQVGPDPSYHSSLTVFSADDRGDETLWLFADRPSPRPPSTFAECVRYESNPAETFSLVETLANKLPRERSHWELQNQADDEQG